MNKRKTNKGRLVIRFVEWALIWGLAFTAVGAQLPAAVRTNTAASASHAAVLAAVNAADSGDTVLVPAGSATWDKPLVITKGIRLIGAGIGQTIITSAYAGGSGFDDSNFLIVYKPANPGLNEPFRLSGFTWNVAEKSGWLKINNRSALSIVRQIRIDHNRVDNTLAFCFLLYGHAYGVMDSNDFNDGIFRFLGTDGSAWSNLSFHPGGADQWYMEDNTIEQSGHYAMPLYAEGGARYCVRHNVIGATEDFYPLMDAHGNQPNAHHSTMGVEIYENTVNAGSSGGHILDLRGGSAIVYNNRINTTGSVIGPKVREEYQDALNSPATGPTGQPQHVSEAYFWNNTKNGTTRTDAYISGTLDYGGEKGVVPQANRDFWNQLNSFNGTTGIGVGLLSARPATCTKGVAYWATDTKTLYRAVAQNAWEIFYKPYTYPHPLRNEDTTLPQPSLAVSSPNGGENWAAGSARTISWTTTGTVDNVKIEYSTNGGASFTQIFASVPNSGSLAWTVPNTPSTSCLVRVSQASTGIPQDVSNAVFTISSAPTLSVNSPNGGENWAAGSARTISWTTTGTVDNVKIEYSTNAGLSYFLISSSAPNTGSLVWTVPNTPSTSCLVRVSRASTGTPLDVSNLAFAITEAVTEQIHLNKAKLNFGYIINGRKTRDQSVTVSASSSTIGWTVFPGERWIRISRASGSGTLSLTVGVDPSGLPPGSYSGRIDFNAPAAGNSPQSLLVDLKVYPSGTKNIIIGSFDTPQAYALVAGSIPVTGWALHDPGIERIKIYRDPIPGEPFQTNGCVYVGDATFIEGARSDIEMTYIDYPLNDCAGWGLMVLTNVLPNKGNGTFTLYAVGIALDGSETELGSKVIVCDNASAVKPFGTIDTPNQGGTASGGAYPIMGWALTPLPNAIPPDGSTITVWVNGRPVEHPSYGHYREDIAATFPGYANAAGAVGYSYIDTTTLPNGVHTIAWSVKDSAGNEDGIGSRYFSVLNTDSHVMASTAPPLPARWAALPADMSRPISFRIGLDARSGEKPGFETRGCSQIEIFEVERLELTLGEPGSGRYSGSLVLGDKIRALPIGSHLDPDTGVFTWQPGPGFLGDYELLFVKYDGNRAVSRKTVQVTIVPKF